ncbi:hypothetical protein B0J13DRAFT_161264 [Dactylonectria estremocensis]|uniref:Uncharacterized protein n=1 Tax=Dactylonectria estremocensis TaxID=1079267 RepID=A0A9P9DJA1_9HYPO|nr:hypothetical protein B0J13DRAFT_161264 [Dactylonectria estremocensis]
MARRALLTVRFPSKAHSLTATCTNWAILATPHQPSSLLCISPIPKSCANYRIPCSRLDSFGSLLRLRIRALSCPTLLHFHPVPPSSQPPPPPPADAAHLSIHKPPFPGPPPSPQMTAQVCSPRGTPGFPIVRTTSAFHKETPTSFGIPRLDLTCHPALALRNRHVGVPHIPYTSGGVFAWPDVNVHVGDKASQKGGIDCQAETLVNQSSGERSLSVGMGHDRSHSAEP